MCVHVCVCVCQFWGKTNSLTFSAQICSKVDLGLAIQKTIVGIRINIFKIVCVQVCVCVCVPILRQNKQLDFFSPNLLKSGSRVGNSENYCQNKNQHPGYTICTNFQSKWTTLNFSAQICPKKDLGFEAEKNNVGIRINIAETLCVPIFSQTG